MEIFRFIEDIKSPARRMRNILGLVSENDVHERTNEMKVELTKIRK